MADKKISELTSITGSNVSDANDTIAIVDSSAGQTKKITREELFKDVDGATFTGDVTLSSANNYIGNTSGSNVLFNREDGPANMYSERTSYSSSDNLFQFVDKDNDPVARIVGRGTSLANDETVVTREKGDARYAQLEGQQFINSDAITDFTVGRSANQHIAFWGSSARNSIDSVSQAGAGKNLRVSVTNPDSTPTLTIRLNSTDAASFTPTLSTGTSVVNRGTGDARYAQISSDERLKENISEMEDVGVLIDSLRPVRFNWKENEGDPKPEGLMYGMVAQEVSSTAPEIALGSEETTMGIDSLSVISILIKEVQELRKRVAEIENI